MPMDSNFWRRDSITGALLYGVCDRNTSMSLHPGSIQKPGRKQQNRAPDVSSPNANCLMEYFLEQLTHATRC